MRHRAIWYVYSRVVGVAAALQAGTHQPDPEFAALGFKQGLLDGPSLTHLFQLLKNADRTEIRQEDYSSGYESNQDLKQYEAVMNTGHKFLVLDREHLMALNEVLEELAPQIEKCIGSRWRVVNVRSWKSLPATAYGGMNDWHYDGFPQDIRKIMIYLAPTGPEEGTTELLLADGSKFSVSGPLGRWLFFKNSQVLHRGVAPKCGERLVVEITIAPSLRRQQQAVCAGLNAAYPKFPWINLQVYDEF